MRKKDKFTQIYFNEADSMTEIDTYNADLKRRLRSFAAAYPDLCRIVEEDDGRMSAVIDKHRFGFKLTAPYSEERKQAIREAGKAKGIHIRLKKVGGGARERRIHLWLRRNAEASCEKSSEQLHFIRTCVQPYTNRAKAFSPGLHSEKGSLSPARTHVRMYG